MVKSLPSTIHRKAHYPFESANLLYKRCNLTYLMIRTEEEIITLQGASEADIDKAVAAARRAFEGEWSELEAKDRGALIYKLAELIERDRKLLASIDSFDNGKSFSDAYGLDLLESYNVFRYYAGTADKIMGKTIETSPKKLAYVLQEPLGVCGQIIPW